MSSISLLATLEKLRNQPRENQTAEFKSNLNDSKEIGEYISALANSAILEKHDRAWLVWGIQNETHDIIGTTFNPFTQKIGNQYLIMWLTQYLSPKADFKFHEVLHPEGRVIMLEIHTPRVMPIAFGGVRYIRIDSYKTTLKDHSDKEARIFEILGMKEDWTGIIIPDATLDDLDPAAVAFARNKFTEYLTKIGSPEIANVEQWDTATLLNKARITKQGKITRSALILLGKDESQHFLSPADTKISWILRDVNNSNVSNQHFGIPFLLSSEAIFQKIRNVQLEYMPGSTLFPTPISQYDTWVIREALHNCIAHQDYSLGGKINLVEFPDKLVFSNLGTFTPPSIQWMLEHQAPPEHYRNQWLIEGMIRLRMIDQMGSGIRRMFETQRKRFFPLPDYLIETNPKPRVEVTISGKILDTNYTQVLMKRADLRLDEVVLLDKVQKKIKIDAANVKRLKTSKLIEGRAPNYYVSSKVADWTSQKASYIRNRSLDDDYFRDMILEFLQKYGRATRQEIDELLMPKLSEILEQEQKYSKISNLIQSLRMKGRIRNNGARGKPVWVIA